MSMLAAALIYLWCLLSRLAPKCPFLSTGNGMGSLCRVRSNIRLNLSKLKSALIKPESLMVDTESAMNILLTV